MLGLGPWEGVARSSMMTPISTRHALFTRLGMELRQPLLMAYLAMASIVFRAPILQNTSLLDGIPLPVDGPCIAYALPLSGNERHNFSPIAILRLPSATSRVTSNFPPVQIGWTRDLRR
jgi:hypothetical protein